MVVNGTPDELIAQGYIKVGKSFPVFIDPKSGEEYALARTERKTGEGYHGFEFDAGPHVTPVSYTHLTLPTICSV